MEIFRFFENTNIEKTNNGNGRLIGNLKELIRREKRNKVFVIGPWSIDKKTYFGLNCTLMQ
jgi:hypothetical protein